MSGIFAERRRSHETEAHLHEHKGMTIKRGRIEGNLWAEGLRLRHHESWEDVPAAIDHATPGERAATVPLRPAPAAVRVVKPPPPM